MSKLKVPEGTSQFAHFECDKMGSLVQPWGNGACLCSFVSNEKHTKFHQKLTLVQTHKVSVGWPVSSVKSGNPKCT